MALQISQILPRSTASRNGLKAGDTIVSINGHPIRDFLDLQYYSGDFELNFVLEKPDGKRQEVCIQRESNKALGIEPISHNCRKCQNKCVFCFIDQMPPGLRESLYLKDDDLVYSFVFGNYITLTNLSEADFERIMEQRISPLYISVHSTNRDIRRRMMGYKKDYDILGNLKRLARNSIQMNVQIVCVPGYNDANALSETLEDLLSLGDEVISIGVVPVGLSKFRENLPVLQPFDKAIAEDCLQRIDTLRDQGNSHVYAADEIFVLAERAIPDQEYYQDFPQIENGIGMLRILKDNFKSKRAKFLRELRKHPYDYVMLTGKSAYSSIEDIASYLSLKLDSQKLRTQLVRNDFCGDRISVAGLLTFSDLSNQVELKDNEIPIIPGSIFNYEFKTLDGATIHDLKELWKREIIVVDQYFEDWDWQ